MRALKLLSFLLLIAGISQPVIAQVFTPVAVTGFNQDVIAESGPSSLATTTFPIDGVTTSNMIIYTEAFRTFAGFSGGGIPDNGIITDADGSYQLASYTGNNVLLLQRTQTGSLSFQTPSKFSLLRLLAFSAEGASLINATVYFTDGTSTPYIVSYSLADWYNSTTNVVIAGYGRCKRVSSAPYGEEAYPVNPRMYYVEIALNCIDQLKDVESIQLDNVTGGSSIYPNAVVLGVSGIAFSQIITPVITPADCSGPTGSISLNVTGSSPFYTFSWNTTPVQTGSTATGLVAGNYTCTIGDISGCPFTYSGTVPLNNNASITATANPIAICPGTSVQLTANVLSGSLTDFNWAPGGLPGQAVTVNPAGTTTYTVVASGPNGCNATAQVLVTVNQTPALPVLSNVTVCNGGTAVLQVQNPVAGNTYQWFGSATGGAAIATGTSFQVSNAVANSTYYVEAINVSGCTSSRVPVSVLVNANAPLPVANDVVVCPGTDVLLQVQNPQAGFTYNWYGDATGSTLLSSGTSHAVSNVTSLTTLYVDAVNSFNCPSSGRLPVTISIYPVLATPVVTVSATSFSAVTFSWQPVPGAVGYEVSTDGTTFTAPSGGTTATSHIISGLTGNQTVGIQVRALGAHPCETSALSTRVTGTTLSSREIFVPNVFTPNDDNRNDVLYVYGNYIGSLQFNIFNQWGEMIFSSTQLSAGWDGKYKGRQQPVGVYVYTLKVVLQDGVEVSKKGSVSLIR